MSPYPNLVNVTGVRELIMNEPNVITRRFMIAVKFYLTSHMYDQKEPQPITDFDVLFFMTIVRDFFQEHEFIRDILDGKEINSFEADD